MTLTSNSGASTILGRLYKKDIQSLLSLILGYLIRSLVLTSSLWTTAQTSDALLEWSCTHRFPICVCPSCSLQKIAVPGMCLRLCPMGSLELWSVLLSSLSSYL